MLERIQTVLGFDYGLKRIGVEDEVARVGGHEDRLLYCDARRLYDIDLRIAEAALSSVVPNIVPGHYPKIIEIALEPQRVADG